MNTANPGLRASWWPTNNEYGGRVVPNPYGDCQGQEDAACAYMYGYAKAFDDAYLRTVSEPGAYLWWLDVETGNSWSGDKNANRADLEGMADFSSASEPGWAFTPCRGSGHRSSATWVRPAASLAAGLAGRWAHG